MDSRRLMSKSNAAWDIRHSLLDVPEHPRLWQVLSDISEGKLSVEPFDCDLEHNHQAADVCLELLNGLIRGWPIGHFLLQRTSMPAQRPQYRFVCNDRTKISFLYAVANDAPTASPIGFDCARGLWALRSQIPESNLVCPGPLLTGYFSKDSLYDFHDKAPESYSWLRQANILERVRNVINDSRLLMSRIVSDNETEISDLVLYKSKRESFWDLTQGGMAEK